jgi:hypothetical protein
MNDTNRDPTMWHHILKIYKDLIYKNLVRGPHRSSMADEPYIYSLKKQVNKQTKNFILSFGLETVADIHIIKGHKIGYYKHVSRIMCR